MIKLFALIIFIISFCPDVATARTTTLPDQAIQYIKITYPNYTIQTNDASTYDIADLDGDGIQDIALILTFFTDDEYHIRILILKGLEDGTFRTFAVTKPLAMPRHGVEFESGRHSLYIHSYYRGDGTIFSSYRYQFQFRKSHFEMIRLEFSAEAQVETEPSYRDEFISVNYLTGDRITTYKRKGKVTKRVRSKIPSAPLIRFENFEDLMFLP